MKENLTEDTRKAILNIKEALLQLDEKYSSIFIYQAVVEFGIKNYMTFCNRLKITTQLSHSIGSLNLSSGFFRKLRLDKRAIFFSIILIPY